MDPTPRCRTLSMVPIAGTGEGSKKMIQVMVGWLQARVATDERGAAAVEYGLLVALIAAAVIATVTLLGGELNTAFKEIQGHL